MSHHVMSCHVTSCHVIVSFYSRILLPNLSPEPSKFFYSGGRVATTRFSKPWPCAGIRLGATLSLWRRVHCERARVAPCTFLSRSRGRLRGSGVLEVCRGHAAGVLAGVPRRCAVHGSGRVLYTHGERAFRVAGCGDRACWERAACWLAASAAPCRGDWVRGVSRARMMLRAVTCVSRGRRGTPDACPRSGRHWRVDPRGRCGETCIWTLVRVRFTWQVWSKVATGTGGVAKVDSRGRRGEARTQRAFRVAGVGNGASGGLAGHRFAWQAQGIVRGS